jgi:NAD(P)H-dependent FMN reductase
MKEPAMATPTLQVITGSTRPGRVGAVVADWFASAARAHGGFTVETVDLAEVALPLLDEPEHPALGRYTHEHTRQWSAIIRRGDVHVFVVPEYNHGYNAATKNAIDYLHAEWRDKTIGFVSYGGVAAGTRAVQALKPVFLSVKAVPVNESVNIPFVASLIAADGSLSVTDGMASAAKAMLDELVRRDRGLRQLREPLSGPASA